MSVTPSVIDLIGHTPLVRLNRLSDETGCEILGKAEFMNPGQSVKDRAALYIIRDAERRGHLRPGFRLFGTEPARRLHRTGLIAN